MTNVPRAAARRMAAVAVCLCVSSCVATRTAPAPDGPGTARTPTGESPAPQTARDLVVLGKSTKADVAGALGAAIVVRFDSGYEVWVYLWRSTDPVPRVVTELVVLFDPSGVATKARVRRSDETRDQRTSVSREPVGRTIFAT